jgi:carbonic anhydrase
MSKSQEKRKILYLVGVFWIACCLGLFTSVAGENEKAGLNSPEAQKLVRGNDRFTSNALQSKDYATERQELAKGQKPYAIVLTCSDSRVSPEILFDESLGKIFVVRVAGNVVDPIIIGSMEYAAEHLGSKFVLVLGHSACGAVKATIAGGEIPPNIQRIADAIAPAVAKAKEKKLEGKELEKEAIEDNVTEQLAQLRSRSPILAELEHKGELQIMGGVYDIASGKVSFFK